MTGFDYSDLTAWLKAAGQETGVTVYRHAKNSDPFFARSDNQALADAGVPAHTLVAALIFPDYHQPGDHWEKLDYENMAAGTRTCGGAEPAGGLHQAVRWNADNPKAAEICRGRKGAQRGKINRTSTARSERAERARNACDKTAEVNTARSRQRVDRRVVRGREVLGRAGRRSRLESLPDKRRLAG